LPIDLGQKVVENDLEIYPIFSLLEGKYDTPLLEADYRLEAISEKGSGAKTQNRLLTPLIKGGSRKGVRSQNAESAPDPNGTKLTVTSIKKRSWDCKMEFRNSMCTSEFIMAFAKTP
jgi:hypothetical protein